jgi:hypothetical protein
MTADLCSHLLAEALKDAAQRIDDALRGVMNRKWCDFREIQRQKTGQGRILLG